jgi:hypothetical protein
MDQEQASKADSLWEDLVTKVTEKIGEFAKENPEAQRRDLRAERRNPNNLTVQTMVQPIIKMEIILTPRSHILVYTTIPKSGDETKTQQRFNFKAAGSVCFSDENGDYSAQALANALCHRAMDFVDSNK